MGRRDRSVPSLRVSFVIGGMRFHLPSFFFFNDSAATEIYTLSLHDALPICWTTQSPRGGSFSGNKPAALQRGEDCRSEEHTSELQSHSDLVCRLLLEKKNNGVFLVKKAGLFTAVVGAQNVAGLESQSPALRL